MKGVIAGADEATKLGYSQLEMGFNWFYRTDPDNERAFWEGLRDRGGAPFVAALGWIGLDAYPGTFFPPETPPEGTPADPRDAVVNALSTLRCFARIPAIPKKVPIHVQENGYPTGPGQRTYERQAQTLTRMVQGFHDFRGTYNVSDYRWFNLRDAQTDSPNFQQQYGLMTDDYRPKPAFGTYRDLVAALSTRSVGPPITEPPTAAPRLSLALVRLRTRRAGGRPCAVSGARVTLRGPDLESVRSGRFSLDGGAARRDALPPFRQIARPRLARVQRPHRVDVTAELADGRQVVLSRRFRSCGKPSRGTHRPQ